MNGYLTAPFYGALQGHLRQFLTLSALLLSGCASWQPDRWREEDTLRQVMAEALLVVDHGQTLEIAARPDRWYETNPILGPYPSRGEVNAYFMAMEVVHPIVAWALPTNACIVRWLPCDWRAMWQHATIVVQAGTVSNNYQLGIGFGF